MRIAIISDIHGNLEALEAVLAAAGAVEAVWCLGDLVGYGPDPAACVDLARECNFVCVAGNHDLATAGLMDSADFNAEADEAIQWTAHQLNAGDRAYLGQLPQEHQWGDFTLAHGSPRDHIWEYLAHLSVARLNFVYFATRYCLVGHTHVPLIFQAPLPEDRPQTYTTLVPRPDEPIHLDLHRMIINPGGVGQPRDGHPEAAYMILDTRASTIVLHRVPYPVEVVQRKMLRAGLPDRLARRLSYGW